MKTIQCEMNYPEKLIICVQEQGPYWPTILENIPSLVLHTFLYLEAFECNTTSDWLNRIIWFSHSEAVLHSDLQILEKKTKNVLENGW